MWQILVPLIFLSTIEACIERKLEFGKVCVCNSSYCDEVPAIGKIAPGNIKIYLTSDSSPGFNVREKQFGASKEASVATVNVNTGVKFQKILGFGGAFTGATGINIKLLPEAAQTKLLESYFGDTGIELSVQRVPIGSSDYSLIFKSLDEHPNDMDLKYFELGDEELNYKVYITINFRIRFQNKAC